MSRFTSALIAFVLVALPGIAAGAAEPRDKLLAQAQPGAAPVRPAAAPSAAAAGAPQRLDEVRARRTQVQEGSRTIIREPGRQIIREAGTLVIRPDEVERTRAGAVDTKIDRKGDETVATVYRPDGQRVVTVLDEHQRLLRRSRIDRAGKEIVIVDNPPMPSIGMPLVQLPPPARPVVVEAGKAEATRVAEMLAAAPVETIERPFVLEEVRQSVAVRERMPRLDLDAVGFPPDAWEVKPDQLRTVAMTAEAMIQLIRRSPAELFLVEGHADSAGSDIDNLSLADRRAESIARVLTAAYGVPPENMVTQGYGDQVAKLKRDAPPAANRISIRRITPLLAGTAQAVR
jgi:OmpA-OmpF porin, OOP family